MFLSASRSQSATGSYLPMRRKPERPVDLGGTLLPMLEKPAVGAPCNGCGWCCQQEICGMAEEALGLVDAPCPALVSHDGRFWCSIIEMADRMNVAFGSHMKWRLGIGSAGTTFWFFLTITT